MRTELPGERWLPVPGWEGLYEVSDQGRVYSVRRSRATKSGRMMSLARHKSGYRYVYLRQDGRVEKGYSHRLVLAAFVGPCPEGQEVRHLDGNPQNNVLNNLAYGTPSENHMDMVRHGTHPWAGRTSCTNGHVFTEHNTLRTANGRRQCRTCSRFRNQAYRARKALKAAGYGPSTETDK